jgi:hypothetical protein
VPERDRRPILVVTAVRRGPEPTTFADTIDFRELLEEKGFDVGSTGLLGLGSATQKAEARVRAPFVGVEPLLESAGWEIDSTRIIHRPSAGHGPLRYIVGYATVAAFLGALAFRATGPFRWIFGVAAVLVGAATAWAALILGGMSALAKWATRRA